MSTATVKAYLDKLATQTGLPIYITEHDINLADDTQQQTVMADHCAMFWTDPNVKGVTLWGYVEGATWLPNTGLMSSSGAKRPAMTWLLSWAMTMLGAARRSWTASSLRGSGAG